MAQDHFPNTPDPKRHKYQKIARTNQFFIKLILSQVVDCSKIASATKSFEASRLHLCSSGMN